MGLRKHLFNKNNRLIFVSTFYDGNSNQQFQFDEIWKEWDARVRKEFFEDPSHPVWKFHYVYVGKYSFKYVDYVLALYFFFFLNRNNRLQTRMASNSTLELPANCKSWKTTLRDFTTSTMMAN